MIHEDVHQRGNSEGLSTVAPFIYSSTAEVFPLVMTTTFSGPSMALKKTHLRSDRFRGHV